MDILCDIMLCVLLSFCALIILIILFLFYQLLRSNAVFEIIIKWNDNNDEKLKRHTYNSMFGSYTKLKYPREKHFK